MRQRRTSLLRDRACPPIFVEGLPADFCGGLARLYLWRVHPPILVAGFDVASIISSHFLPLPDLRNFSRTLAAV